ncbi:phospholipase D-like domain-containing anti-phage protein [Thermoclostridium stercorarium]|nr:phospholipase D-like domain-containing anti-phage protein [Thermoclostridium stercorarium]
MLNHYSSRRNNLLDEFLNPSLKNAQGYDRLAGYFCSSVLEVAGEAIESVDGPIRVVCNSNVKKEDVEVAKMVKRKLVKEWKYSRPEEKAILCQERFKKLYDLLKSGKMQVKVMPDDVYGLVHAKAGVITRHDGSKIAYIGSVNETRAAWTENYEMLWSDDSEKSVKWVQEEFDFFWNNPYALELCDAIIEDIGRIAQRRVVSLDEWRKNPEPASVVIESPMYKDGLELWNHQKYFIKMVFEEHVNKGGARYILADEVGLGKTAQLALIAELTALYSDKPVLILVPKTLLFQWQDELKSMFGIPSAVFDGNKWVIENGREVKPSNGRPAILQCPRKIAIISHGLIKRASRAIEPLLELEYECVLVDEAHKARRKNLNKPAEEPESNNLMNFLVKLSLRTKTMILATATPIQLHPVEGWDLLYILAQGSERILGSEISQWKRHHLDGIAYICGQKEMPLGSDAWQWIKDPLPSEDEDNMSFLFGDLRKFLGLRKDETKARFNYSELDPHVRDIVDLIAREDFFKNYNPFIRFMVRRRRETLEKLIDPETGKPYLEKIEIKFGEGQDRGLSMPWRIQRAYDLALDFTSLLKERGAKGFYKTLLLRRVCSSIHAGLKTARAIFAKKAIDESILTEDELEDMEDDDLLTLDLSNAKELEYLSEIIDILDNNREEDLKYNKIKEILLKMKWIERGCVIFSEYFDTAQWTAQRLSEDIPDVGIGLYAGIGNSSGIYKKGKLHVMPRDEIKGLVLDGRLKVLVGTDAAGEGLNLQALGTVINIDLPWNPIRLEQRIGRIRRAGQLYKEVYVYNLFYRGSIEEHVHNKLKKRIKHTEEIIGPVSPLLGDERIKDIIEDIDEKEEHPFDIKYRQHVAKVDWENVSTVLNDEERVEHLIKPWM